jgi:hypothetical protein
VVHRTARAGRKPLLSDRPWFDGEQSHGERETKRLSEAMLRSLR